MMWLLPALWALLFAFPPVIRGERAGHSLAFILKPDGPINPDGSGTEYAHVHEKGEFRLCKLAGIAAGIPFLWVGGPLVLLFQAIAMVLADQLARRSNVVDYAGHGAEIMAAEADGAIGYREAEIARNARAGLSDVTLRRWHWLARIVHFLGRI